MVNKDGFETLAKEVYVKALAEDAYPVSPSAGRLFYIITYLIVKSRGKVNVVEVGTGYGFSTLWFAKAIADSGCRGCVYTFEISEERAKVAIGFIRRAGLGKYVKVVVGDVRDYISKLGIDEVDILFIDAKKEEYLEYLNAVRPYLRDGALIIAHNVIAPKPHELSDYLKTILEGSWVTVITQVDYGGLGITLYKSERTNNVVG